MLDAKMKAKLKNFNKNFNKEKKRADELGGFAEIPDGKYRAKVSSCELKNSNAGELHLVFIFEIIESPEDESLVGSKASKWCNVEKEDGPAYLIRDLRKFGIELEDLEQLPEIAKLIDNQKPEIKLNMKTGNSGQFSYIDQVISELDAGDHATSEDSEDEDEESEEDDDAAEAEETTEEEEAEEEAEEDVQLEVGTTVVFNSKSGEKIEGQITSIDEKGGTVSIKAGTRSFKGIAVDRLSLPETTEVNEEEEEVEEEEEEVKKPAKAAAKKPEVKKVAPAKKAAPAKKTVAPTKKRK